MARGPLLTSEGHRGALDEGRAADDPIRILALDGGGMRGVMTARILVELERLSGRPIAGMFDIVAGTSTGGMIALALTKPGPDGKPAMTAQEVLDTYVQFGQQIFPRAQWRPLAWARLVAARPILAQRIGALTRPAVYGNARYSNAGLKALLTKMLGTSRLSESMADVIVPSYDWRAGRAYVFRSRGSRNGEFPDPSIVDVALATTAAPTYFPAFRMRNGRKDLVLIDGGVVANNPASVAYYEALYHTFMGKRPDPDFLVVSLGTGQPPEEVPTYQELQSRSWLRMGMGMLGIMFDGSSEIVDALLTEVIRPRHPNSRYWRLNAELRGVRLNLDDASPQQVDGLIGLAERLIAQRSDELREMVQLLTTSRSAPSVAPDPHPAEAGPAPRASRARRRRSTD